MPVRPDDREEFIRLRGTAITAGRAEELASIATGGQPVESEVVEELRLRVCKLKGTSKNAPFSGVVDLESG